jgi:S1-C subfamily serine protease
MVMFAMISHVFSNRLRAVLLVSLVSICGWFGITPATLAVPSTPATGLAKLESTAKPAPKPSVEPLVKPSVKPAIPPANAVAKAPANALAAPTVAAATVLPAGTAAPKPIAKGSFVAAAVRRVGNAVVRIDTEKTIARRPSVDPMLDDPFFRRFFSDELGGQGEEHLRGQGSGFLIDDSGVILTNSHVVNGADRVTVTLKDGRKFEGTVRGVDEVTDLAVVKVDGKDLPVVALGDSEAIAVGDWAIAVGNPLGLDNTVTLGIVSTLNRSSSQIGMSNKRLDFIQTDAAINPGNSGGPLLNDNGEVIGINTAIRADAMGIGFAIPINKAKDLKAQLIRGERIRHPYLGIQMSSFDADMAKQNNTDPNSLFKLPEVSGVIVMRVLENTPAAKAGIRRYDVITAIDGQPIASADLLQQTVDRSKVGQPLKVELHRGDQTMTIKIKSAELKDDA